MIQALKSNQIDKAKWDACIEHAHNGNIYGLYGSIEVACSEWIGLVQDDYTAVAALPLKRKLGLTYSWHPQFLGPLGIFCTEDTSPDMEEFTEMFKKSSWWIKMFYWQNLQPLFQVQPWNYQILEIGQRSVQEIKQSYNENTRRNIAKALKQDVTLVETNDVDLLVNSFREEKGSMIENLNDDSYRLLHRLISYWKEKDMASIKAVYTGDTLLAIGCFLHWRNRVVYYKGAVTTNGKNTGAMHFLIDHEIQAAVKPGNIFDFGGSHAESVARFYMGFGGTNHQFYMNEFKRFKI